MEGGASVMTEIIANVGSILTAVIGWVGDVFTMIAGNELFMFLILLPLGVSLIYFVVRLISSIRSRSI